MTTEECKRLLRERSPILFVDVREADEIEETPFFRVSHPAYANIPLTLVAFLPKEELHERLTSIADRSGVPLADTRIVMACRSGSRSMLAVERLASAGIPAENLEGGRIAWGEVF